MGIVTLNNKIVTKGGNIVISNVADHIKYGWLYNWYAVTNAHGLAPTGYHIPTKTEIDTLITYLVDNGYGYGGSGTDTAKAMASVSSWSASANAGAPGNDSASNNSSGLTLLAAGCRISNGTSWQAVGTASRVWMATEYDSGNAYDLYVHYNITDPFGSVYYAKNGGFPVRFVRDNDTGWSSGDKLVDVDGNVYDTVKIGTQIWTCQNAAVTRYKDGTAIPLITDNTAWGSDTTGARCAFNNDGSYVYN